MLKLRVIFSAIVLKMLDLFILNIIIRPYYYKKILINRNECIFPPTLQVHFTIEQTA